MKLAALALALVAAAPAPSGRIVLSADRAPAVTGEIYRVDLDGRRVDLSRSPFEDTSPLVSPDGKRVAFLSDRTGRQAVYVVGLDARGLRRISPPLPDVVPPQLVGWSPDSRSVLVVTERPNASVLESLAPGRAPRLLARTPGLSSIVAVEPSPDGRLVAYRTGSVVRAVRSDGSVAFTSPVSPGARLVWSAQGRLGLLTGGALRVLDERGRVLARVPADGFAWSPSGRRLATMDGGFLEVREAGRVILRERLLSARAIRALLGTFGDLEPNLAWAGESRVLVANLHTGERIEGASPSAYARANVAVGVPGGRTRRLPQRLWFVHSCGCTSPDGRLAVDTVARGSAFAIRVSPVGGGGARDVASLPGCSDDGAFVAAAGAPRFATARSVVYASVCNEPPANLYTVAPDGGGLRRLTVTRKQQTDPAWSPDRRRIAFASAEGTGLSCKGCPETIWTMDADGTRARALTSPEDLTVDRHPSWSPDGRSIVFSRSSTESFGDLFVVPAAGGAVTSLHVAGTDPAWGPARIAYLGNADVGGGRIVLRTVTPDGSDRRTLASGNLSSPAWSRDGRLAVLDSRNGVHVVELAGGRKTRIALPFADARSLSWSPDGTRLLVVARRLHAGPFDVYSVRLDGTAVRRLTKDLDAL